mmetsp:Transcript_44104/g.114713  ORF Transcript_44104/g.114713 Transcript_44104/m.114713 type:complete len:292 (+) Transcript_44104:131-1006(+)
MAREDARSGVCNRSRAERTAARQAAQASADAALKRLSAERDELKGKLNHLLSATALALDLPAEVADRVVALVPCLAKLVEGIQPDHEEILRRNVALHAVASGLKVSCAGGKELRHAQHGPRLESSLRGELFPRPFPWNRGAADFVPGAAAHFLARVFEVDVCQAVINSHVPRGVWEPIESSNEASNNGLDSTAVNAVESAEVAGASEADSESEATETAEELPERIPFRFCFEGHELVRDVHDTPGSRPFCEGCWQNIEIGADLFFCIEDSGDCGTFFCEACVHPDLRRSGK